MAGSFYNANPLLKNAGVPIEFTPYQLDEYIKCKQDPIYFIKNYVKIISLDRGMIPFELFPYQERFILALHENRRVLGMFPRQMGKTTTAAAYIVWYLLFNDDKTVAILANKAAAAREIMSRVQLMIEQLPKWLQQGVVEWNKGNIAFENNSKAFTAATSSSGIRGKSCVAGDTRVCVEEDGKYFYSTVHDIINNSRFIHENTVMKKHTVYKTINRVNNKIYVGYHSVDESKIERLDRGRLSCFSDGYLGSGKLLKRALEKYGPESFDQEIIGIFDSQEEAELVESMVVDEIFSLREDTYNLALGGNVRVLVGENNGFYGKTHTRETLEKIKTSREASGLPTYQTIGTDIETGTVFKGYKEILDFYGYDDHNNKNEANRKRIFIGKLISDGILNLDVKSFSDAAVRLYKESLDVHSEERILERKNKLSKLCKERFTGVSQSKETIEIRVRKHREWIENNPDLHSERMNKINKNPEKIRKSAEKHRGMKRSEETRKNISQSLIGKPSHNKGKTQIIHVDTGEKKYINKNEPIPDGWKINPGGGVKNAGRKSYTNGTDYKMFKPGEEPDGWVPGARKKPRK